jgi:nucleoside-diphosphate-sugar epimerase
MEHETLCCGVTGAHGYVGSVIAGALRNQGARVVGLNHRGAPSAACDAVVPYTLGQELPGGAFDGMDALVHCAWDFKASKWADIKRGNVDGSLRLFADAHAAGVKRLIFISTVSAFEGCRSLYGRAKLAVEQGGRPYKVIAVRPGLVYDDQQPRGMVGALSALVARSPLIPLIGSGRQMLYPCHADDLGRLVAALCATGQPASGPVVAASSHGLTFRQILADVATRKGKRVLFVPVPYGLVLVGLRAAEGLGLKTRLRSDSLVSLVNQNPSLDFTATRTTGVPFRELATAEATA